MEPLPRDAVDEAMATLPAWSLSEDGKHIVRALLFPDFAAAFGFMTAVAIEAQAADHHPDWSNSYATVAISLTTHAAGGLTERDFALARKADALAVAALPPGSVPDPHCG